MGRGARVRWREGLRHVVIGANVEPVEPHGEIARRGEEYHRHIAVRANRATDVKPGCAGKPDVENRQVEGLLVQ